MSDSTTVPTNEHLDALRRTQILATANEIKVWSSRIADDKLLDEVPEEIKKVMLEEGTAELKRQIQKLMNLV